MALGIGSIVWVFDGNHRVYPKEGSVSRAPIYREHFRPIEIVGETKVSWLLAHAPWDKSTKVNKKTLEGIFPTQESVDDAVYVHDNRHRLAEALRSSHDPALVRAVAKLVDDAAKNLVRVYIPW